MTISQWADSERRLSQEASAEPGRWITDRAPYQRAIMDAVSSFSVETVVIKSSSQVGKTEILLNTIGYFIQHDPSPILLLQPTLEIAEAFSKDRLTPMIRDTPSLTGKVVEAKSRKSGNTILHKRFPGGHITMAGANSPRSLASRPIRILLGDEVDRYPPSAGTEGDPISLAERRTPNFWNRKKVYTSTPTVKGLSRIDALYEESTKDQWFVPCPLCGHMQPLTWGQMRFPDDRYPEMTHECCRCRRRSAEAEWKAGGGQWISANPKARIRGFHLWAAISPWMTWTEIYEAYLRAKAGGQETLKVFWNTILGECWEEAGDAIETDALAERREVYDGQVPDRALVLTAGVDVQDDRLEVEIVGWTVGKESWGIAYFVLPGDPIQEAVWQRLDELLQRPLHYADGAPIGISAVCIDSGGHCTPQVYEFCAPREARRIFAIKGRAGMGLPIIGTPSKNNRRRVFLFPVGVDTCKDLLFSRLRLGEPGPGYCHFPIDADRGYDKAYFEGLTAEKRVIKFSRGKKKVSWEKKSGARNEPIDLRNYATAALEILNPDLEAIRNARGAMERQAGRPQLVRKRRVVSQGVR